MTCRQLWIKANILGKYLIVTCVCISAQVKVWLPTNLKQNIDNITLFNLMPRNFFFFWCSGEIAWLLWQFDPDAYE